MSLRILMIIPSLPTGGAEWAFVRMAQALALRHEVMAYVPYRCDSSPALLSALNAHVRCYSLPLPHLWFHRLLYKIDLKLPMLRLEQRLHRWVLKALHHRHDYAVVNTHLMSGTQLACEALSDVALPIVESDHGDYAIRLKQDAAMPEHHPIFSRLNGIACPSQANLAYIRTFPWKLGFKAAVIPYASPHVARKLDRKTSHVFTFGLVSRGIAEKGWAEALAAFRELQKSTVQSVRLVFVGEGAEIERLRQEVDPTDPTLVFAGHQSDPSGWIAEFDVGLLPSYFAAESLPNVVIECQAQGKPVIATAVGGIREMLNPEGEDCGLLIPLNPETGRADVSKLAQAMRTLMQDQELYHKLSAAASHAFERYAPERCVEAYTELFQSLARSDNRR